MHGVVVSVNGGARFLKQAAFFVCYPAGAEYVLVIIIYRLVGDYKVGTPKAALPQHVGGCSKADGDLSNLFCFVSELQPVNGSGMGIYKIFSDNVLCNFKSLHFEVLRISAPRAFVR